MAVDNRPFKSKEQDGQGNEVIIRDQQLVEQVSQTSMDDGEYFEIVDIDGRMAKISKANMVNIVLEALGIALNDSSKNIGTNVNKALGLYGNLLGNVTVADFASVLGEAGGYTSYALNSNESLEIEMLESGYRPIIIYENARVGVSYLILTAYNVVNVIKGKDQTLFEVSCSGVTVTIKNLTGGQATGGWKFI